MRRNWLIAVVLSCGAAGLWAQPVPLPAGTHADDPAPQAAGGVNEAVTSAESAIEARNFDQARTLLAPYLTAHPGDARALFDLGYLEDAQDHEQAAVDAYQKAIAADPKQFESRLALGLVLARQGHADEARLQFEAATTLNPTPPNPAAKAQAFRALARLIRTTDPGAARKALLQALQLGPESPDDALLTAEIAEASGDAETAEAAYRRVLTKQPDSSAAAAGLVHLLLQQKKYPEAEPLLRAALLRDPDDPALNSQMATLLTAEGKKDEAAGVLEKLHALQPGDATIAGMLAESYTQAGEPDKAEALYAEMSKANPEDADLLTLYGESLIRNRQYAEALPILQRATRLKPDDADAWSSLAFAASQAHDYATALDALAMRSKFVSDTPATYFLRATAYDNLHQKKQAVEAYKQFLAAAHGTFPDQEWQAKHRLLALGVK